MPRWQTLTGIAIGLAIGSFIAGLAGARHPKPPPAGPILSECSGHFRELVIHYEPSAREVVESTYSQFLTALESDVTVYVVCPTHAAFDELLNFVGPVRCRLKPIAVNHDMTVWSRDRWIALGPENGITTLLHSPAEASAEIWPARAGDERISGDIARALSAAVVARCAAFYFDGGDFLVDDETVFVAPRVLHRNIQRTTPDKEHFITDLERTLNRRVVLLDQAPNHHAAMFMVSVGNNTMLVGDPSLGRAFLPTSASVPFPELAGGPDFSKETQHLFDAVARQCADTGYRVVRIPTIPAADGRSYLTYVNCLIDRQGSRRFVYLPFYQNADALNAAARAIWEELGFEVRPVDCTSTYRQFGALHCLVNVLSRSTNDLAKRSAGN
ncbi:MAG TPA: hypothetical protein GYA07_13080 [Verrucomicrobia bacterium]|nr:hypothetical protein [Verrucomicrobiota bacterium]HOP99183.1 agmatine deiminase family protein [Verrucomicrobiota bacterium]